MNLPSYMRASALAVALSVTAAIIMTLAEIGHPAPDGVSTIASLDVRAPLGLVRDALRSAVASLGRG